MPSSSSPRRSGTESSIGVLAGAVAAAVVVHGTARRLVDDTWLQIVPLAGALLAFSLAEAIGGSGFIAAFVGGAAFGGMRRHRGGEVSHLIEQTGAVLAAVTFVLFGAVLLGPAIRDLDLADRALRDAQPHGHPHGPCCDLDAGNGRAEADRRLPRLVRARRCRVHRLRAARVEEEGLPHERAILTTAFVTVGLSVLAHGFDGGAAHDALCRLARRTGRRDTSRVGRGGKSFPGGCRADEHRLDRGRAPDRCTRAAPGRLRDERPRHRPEARLPPDRPDLDRRAAAAPRPLEPPRAVRRRRARPPALGRAKAHRVERVHLAVRRPPAAPRAHAAEAPRRHRVGAHVQRVPARAREP